MRLTKVKLCAAICSTLLLTVAATARLPNGRPLRRLRPPRFGSSAVFVTGSAGGRRAPPWAALRLSK